MGEQWPSLRGRRMRAILERLCGEPLRQKGSHTLFRSQSTYSYPLSIYVDADTLEELRAEFCEAAAFATDDQGDEFTLVEHVERPLIPGAYIRVAVDRRMLDRDQVAHAMASTLTNELQREDFEAQMPLTATGDAVMIACVPDDRLGWAFEQMGEHDGIAVCTRGELVGTLRRVWWSYIAGPQAVVPGGRPTDSLASAGLEAGSTVTEFMQTNDVATGRTLAAAG